MTPILPLETARMLARYNAWADRLVYDAVAQLPAGEATRPRQGLFRNTVHMLNHINVIARAFRAHVEGRPHGYTARNTPDHPPLEALRAEQEEIDDWLVGWADAMDEAALERRVAFEYIGGGAGDMSQGEILLHLVNHGTYHRGFVAEQVYQAGMRAPTTDLTVYLRDVHGRG